MKNVVTRSISGIVYVAVFVGCILLGKASYFVLTEVLVVLGLMEYLRLAEARMGHPLSTAVTGVTLLVGMSCPVLALFGSNWALSLLLIPFFPLVIFVFCCIPLLLFRTVMSTSQDALRMLGIAFTAFFYITLPLSILMFIYGLAGSPLNGLGESTLILVSLIGIWINDTGAYCVGSLFGKNKLCERLSPKKSWEGFWGGLTFVVVFFVIWSLCSNFSVLETIIFGIFGLFLSIFATYGDLFESMLKRTAGVKDSGHLIPGHGGILDRIDSFLFVAYLIILYILVLSSVSFTGFIFCRN